LLIGVNYTIKNKVFINFLLFSAAASLYQFTVRDYKHYALITLVPLFLMYLIIIFDSKHKLKFIIITNILIILNLSYFSLFNIQSTSSSILGFRESNKKELNSLCDKLDKSKSLLSFPTKFFEMHIVCSTFFLVDGSVDKQLDDNQVGNLYELITSKKFEQLIIYNRDDIPSWIIDNDELCKPLNCYTLFNSIDIYGYKVRLSNENKYTIWEKIN
jgi:hypothetical protein